MDKNLLSSILVAAVFLLGATVQFIRGRTVFAIIGLVLGVIYVVLTIIGYIKEKNEKENKKDQP
ncbi:MAG: hypothetical protein IJ917_01075 [Firmicutes bacterium]|nr:hypothetical protein [Bacillota bacterium]